MPLACKLYAIDSLVCSFTAQAGRQGWVRNSHSSPLTMANDKFISLQCSVFSSEEGNSKNELLPDI